MTYPLVPLNAQLWRMLTIRFQRDPLSGEGARRFGGRWNANGTPALYLACDPATAVAEFYQGLAKPGTLAPYRLEAQRIADLTDGAGGPCDALVEHACQASWKAIAARGRAAEGERPMREPPSWTLARSLHEAGAQGALVPSVQNRKGTCLVLWHWRTGEDTGDNAALLSLIDPEGALGTV
ncbi:RES family NAD+ phosphorylase [Novosphingobium sp. YJ-S2-02]|uniref:RES family NAD+ phosphorylase n=1 Tax=Novosphingobium aureum TaxID=2792964 RepID=A0A931HE99_9SPHN|nr:RES family NAD+ phosphorylase [Novosphingobium aureum]MBH0114406.1 RES family NAD+ phosphorylase [Novosphingobium aureum]